MRPKAAGTGAEKKDMLVLQLAEARRDAATQRDDHNEENEVIRDENEE